MIKLFINSFSCSKSKTLACSFVCEFKQDECNPALRLGTIAVFGVDVAPAGVIDGSGEFITRHNSSCGLIYFDAA